LLIASMSPVRERILEINGIRMNVTEQGAGPLVLLLHGFPETSHAWRHQRSALAAAGYWAVAPDLRGYGRSECPADIAAYTSLDVIGDLIALLDALGERQAVVVGGDWGATIAWQAAQLRPDRFRAVVALGVPLMGRAPMLPSRLFPQTEAAMFYTHYFAAPGIAERELELDIGAALRKIYFAASGDAGPREEPATPNPFGMVARNGGLLDGLPDPASLPAWLDPADLATVVDSFEASGFRGGLNYYRNLDRNWALQSAFEGIKVEVPSYYLVGERDTGRAIPGMDNIVAAMPILASHLRGSEVVKGAGHWLQQEAPDAVNAALLGFLGSL
jgi:pimeloyl-ACP methyl ester carboxylesterase